MVRKILLEISSGLSSESTAKHCSASQGDLMQIVDASLQVTSTLLPSRRREPLGISLDNILSRFKRLRERIGQVGLVFEGPHSLLALQFFLGMLHVIDNLTPNRHGPI